MGGGSASFPSLGKVKASGSPEAFVVFRGCLKCGQVARFACTHSCQKSFNGN